MLNVERWIFIQHSTLNTQHFTSVGGEEHIKCGFRPAEELSVLKRSPSFLLHGTNCEFREVSSQLARQVFIEKNAPHAIFATKARPASSRKAIACSRLTPG